MRIGELPGGRSWTGTAPLAEELPVTRELHHAVVAALAVAVQHVDLSGGRDQDVGGAIEAVRLVPPHPGDPQGHEDSALGAELENLLSFPFGRSRLRSSVCRAVGDPDVAFVIDEEAMGPRKESASEVRHEVPAEIKLEDGIQVRAHATVGATPIQHPHVSSVGVRENAGDGSPRAPFWEVGPVRNRDVFAGSLGVGVAGNKVHQAYERSRKHGQHSN